METPVPQETSDKRSFRSRRRSGAVGAPTATSLAETTPPGRRQHRVGGKQPGVGRTTGHVAGFCAGRATGNRQPANWPDASRAARLDSPVTRVVVDPGHAGYDTEVQSDDWTEAAVALNIATRPQTHLATAPNIDITLARTNDAYMPRRAHTTLANGRQADLSLSVHINAVRDADRQGMEAYFRNFATGPASAGATDPENALPVTGCTICATGPGNGHADAVGRIASRGLPRVQSRLMRAVRALHPDVTDLGVKSTPFIVPIGTESPAVHVQISFLTNRKERPGSVRSAIGTSRRRAVDRGARAPSRPHRIRVNGEPGGRAVPSIVDAEYVLGQAVRRIQ